MDAPLRPAVFLDRDGTINVEVDYLSDPAQLELIPGAARSIARLNQAGLPVVLITNQSGIARGMFTEERLAEIHARLADLLARDGAHLDHIEYCPHHPSIGREAFTRKCQCRKPLPGMLLAAGKALGIDYGASWMVGDSLRDIGAGEGMGVRGILVLTGKGRAQLEVFGNDERGPTVVTDLEAAVELILGSAAG